ncbi:AmiS/UreI family transporter [Nonomuraea typhae]|uniref:AmiS/UreI family transporter n=1 Tax=Nonomuraea typhae TaxID=2603600 RepID=UPI0012FB77D7|nr:AmiS/UreI family transporter [Nonomuraea typhae]
MASVGLLYVGAVLFVNAMMLLGKVDGRAAAILNLFVGALQVVTPTVIIVTAGGDPATIMGASGIYLFGFTYLYVGIGLLAGLSTTGVGWFSLFVAIAALVYAAHNAFTVRDYPFAVIWLLWSFLWTLFFLVLGLGREDLTRYTGWVTLVQAWLTAVIPAFLLLTGRYSPSAFYALILAGVCVVAFGGLWMTARRTQEREPSHA